MLYGADHGGPIARKRREAVIALQQLDDVAALVAAVYQLDAGNRQALGENVRGLQSESTRVLAARIPLVSLQSLDQHQLTLVVKHRRIDVVIRQMAAAIVRVVSQKHISRAPVICVE